MIEKNKYDLTDDELEPFKEGANKQIMSSQADSLIKISRIWADFFPANIESAYLGYFFHHFWRYFRFLLRSLPLTYHLVALLQS